GWSPHPRRGPAPRALLRPSQDPGFAVRLVALHALIAHAGETDRFVAALDHQLGDAAARGRRVHHPVPGEAGDDQEVGQPIVPAPDDGVAVQVTFLVQAGPGAVAPGSL